MIMGGESVRLLCPTSMRRGAGRGLGRLTQTCAGISFRTCEIAQACTHRDRPRHWTSRHYETEALFWHSLAARGVHGISTGSEGSFRSMTADYLFSHPRTSPATI